VGQVVKRNPFSLGICWCYIRITWSVPLALQRTFNEVVDCRNSLAEATMGHADNKSSSISNLVNFKLRPSWFVRDDYFCQFITRGVPSGPVCSCTCVSFQPARVFSQKIIAAVLPVLACS